MVIIGVANKHIAWVEVEMYGIILYIVWSQRKRGHLVRKVVTVFGKLTRLERNFL